MTDFQQLANNYVEAWNEQDGDVRRRLVEALFATDATYVDPMASVHGPEAISGLIGAVQAQFPGYALDLIGTPDGHHDQLRFQWGLTAGDEEPLVIGFDVVRVSPAGAITEVFGFLDKVPAAATSVA